MTSRSKRSLVLAVAFACLLVGSVAQAADPGDGLNQGTSLIAAAWQWLVTVLSPTGGGSAPGTSNQTQGEPKAGCEMDPNGLHRAPTDSSNGSGGSSSFHQ
ncbi:MAG TPA: hypothetical protein VGE98_04765 [Thermoanaerobaculia bacterium]